MRDRGRRTIAGKIKSLSQLKDIRPLLRKKGKRVVFTNGCFDILHLGHVKYLEDSAKKGDVLLVAVNSDASVRKIKGLFRPVVGQYDRARTLAALESVDFVTIFNAPTPLRLIRQLRPDVLVKGADWKKENIVGADFVQSYGGRVLTIRLMPGRSTTAIIKRIGKSHH